MLGVLELSTLDTRGFLFRLPESLSRWLDQVSLGFARSAKKRTGRFCKLRADLFQGSNWQGKTQCRSILPIRSKGGNFRANDPGSIAFSVPCAYSFSEPLAAWAPIAKTESR